MDIQGLSEEETLHQYVLYDTKPEKKGPRIINLDDNDKNKNKNKYVPPNSLTIHLSKIPMPELQPKAQQSKLEKGRYPFQCQPEIHINTCLARARSPSPTHQNKGKKTLARPSKDTPSHSPINHPNKPQYNQPRSPNPKPASPVGSQYQGGAMNSRPPPPPPSSRPYSPSSPPWDQPSAGQNNQPKPNAVTSLFDKFHLR
jgi:hypothetical protein